MPRNRLYKFVWSPPARLAWLAAKIYEVPDTEFVDTDLSKGEHLDMEFIKMNPKHEVPIFVTVDDQGKVSHVITESRQIAKHFHKNYNKDEKKNDHWYPSDPEERAKVDEWLAFSDQHHMDICLPPLMKAVNTFGANWRKTFGFFLVHMSTKMMADQQKLATMQQCFLEAEEALSKRRLESVEDLNLGDLAIYLECSLAFAMNTMNIDDHPGLKRVYELMLKVPEFQEIDEKFRAFGNNILSLRPRGLNPLSLKNWERSGLQSRSSRT